MKLRYVKCKSHMTTPKIQKLLVELPLEDDKFASLQENDLKIWDLHDKVKEGAYSEFYFVENNVLFRSIVDNGHKFKARVIPESLVDVVLHLGHTINQDTMDTRGHTQPSCICTSGKV